MKLDLQKGSRARVLAIVIVAIAGIFVARLFYLQVMQYGHYTDIAKATQEKRFVIPASRGEIYALDGSTPVQLVMNQTVYTVFADPKTVTEHDAVLKTLREVAGGNLEPNVDSRLKADNRYQRLATKLSATQRDKIKEKNFSGIGFQTETQRVYPEGQLAGQVLGFVNNDGDGNYGIEGYMNQELKGKEGALQAVTDVRDVPLTIGRQNVRVEAVDGKSPVLSLDRNIQSRVEQALKAGIDRTGATHASAVVMNPNTGKVMAMANFPSYNPGEFSKVTDGSIFNNDTISVPYEPGSTIKTLMLATALNQNVAKRTDTFTNTDSIRVEDRTISNASKGHTGVITFQTAIDWSLNTGMVTLAQRLGNGSQITRGARDIMFDYYHNKFRLGENTGIELANESSGLLISPEHATGNAVRYSNMSFGQGMNATMMQVATAFSAAINGGTFHQPSIINGYMVDGQYQPSAASASTSGVITPATSSEVREALISARSLIRNTGRDGYMIGGKTGTSQVIKNGTYSDNETIGSYVGFGGSEKPEYVIMVKVSGENKELQGARDAVPIFNDISNWMIDYLKLRPRG